MARSSLYRHLGNEASTPVLHRVAVVEAVDVLQEDAGRAAEALGQQIGARVRAVWGDATQRWRVLPQARMAGRH